MKIHKSYIYYSICLIAVFIFPSCKKEFSSTPVVYLKNTTASLYRSGDTITAELSFTDNNDLSSVRFWIYRDETEKPLTGNIIAPIAMDYLRSISGNTSFLTELIIFPAQGAAGKYYLEIIASDQDGETGSVKKTFQFLDVTDSIPPAVDTAQFADSLPAGQQGTFLADLTDNSQLGEYVFIMRKTQDTVLSQFGALTGIADSITVNFPAFSVKGNYQITLIVKDFVNNKVTKQYTVVVI